MGLQPRITSVPSKGYKFLNTNGDWYYILGQKPEDGGGFLKKAIENTGKTPFNQLASTKYPEVDLPTVGSMLSIWADRPSAEYKEEEIFELMTAFANHNKDYFKADYTALRAALANVPTDLSIYTEESRTALAKVLDTLNWTVSRTHQEKVDEQVTSLTQALSQLKPITQVGSQAENDVRALVEDKPSLEIVETELDFEVVERTNPDLAKGERKVVQAGAKGQHREFVAVSALDKSRQVVGTEVSKEAVSEIVEVGTKEAEVITPTPGLQDGPSPQPDLPQVDQGGHHQVRPVAPEVKPLVNAQPASVASEQKTVEEAKLAPVQDQTPSSQQLPETGQESILGLALLGAILGATGMSLKGREED